jgi:hypothetical protein
MLENRHDTLQDDRAVIVFLVGKMDRAPAHLDARCQRSLMHPQPIAPLATKGGDESKRTALCAAARQASVG